MSKAKHSRSLLSSHLFKGVETSYRHKNKKVNKKSLNYHIKKSLKENENDIKRKIQLRHSL